MTSFFQHLMFFVWGVVAFLAFDGIFFLAWVFSGQYPPEDSFYFGMFTKMILVAIQG